MNEMRPDETRARTNARATRAYAEYARVRLIRHVACLLRAHIRSERTHSKTQRSALSTHACPRPKASSTLHMAAPTSRSTSSSSSDDLVASEPATPSSRSSTFITFRPQRQSTRPPHRPVTSPSTPRRDHDRPGMYSFDGHHALGALGGIAYSLVNVVPPSSSSRTTRASYSHSDPQRRVQYNDAIDTGFSTSSSLKNRGALNGVAYSLVSVPPTSPSSRTTRASYPHKHSDPRRRVRHSDVMNISSDTSSSLYNNASLTSSTSPPRSSADRRQRLSLYHLDPSVPPRTTRT